MDKKTLALLGRAVGMLPWRQSEVLLLRTGLGDGHAYSVKRVARIFKLTEAAVKAVEADGLAKVKRYMDWVKGVGRGRDFSTN